MKIGTTIQNEDMMLTVVAYHGNKKGNVALLIQDNESCPYLTAINLTRHKDGKYHWYYGHYTDDFEAAAQDYSERKAALL